MRKYYELIGDRTGKVIGVTSDDGLLHALREDLVSKVGQISKDTFETYGDNPWENPISRRRFNSKIVPVVSLEPILTERRKNKKGKR